MAFPMELGIILLFSILGGVLAVRFRQPSLIGLIIVGSIVGPNSLGLIKDASLINGAIEIGAILLLFTIGIEFSLQRLLNIGLRIIIVATIKIGVVFLVSYYASLLLGFNFITSLYIGVILSITSTVILVKMLEQKAMFKREELPLLVAVLILEDIYGIFALTFFSSINTAIDLSPLNLLTKLIISLAILFISYILLQRILKPIVGWLVKYSTEETITFISLGLCGGMSYFAFLLNLSPSVGAFLAGNIVASLPNSRLFEKAIHPFILTFTSLFFFSVGTIVDFSEILGNVIVVVIFFLITIFVSFLTIGFGSYVFSNFTGKQAVFAGIAMAPIGEFSLLIANEAGRLSLGIDLVSITAGIILLSTIAMSAMINYNEKIYYLTTRALPKRLAADMGFVSKYLNSISFGMIKDKVSTKRILTEWRTILNNIIAIFFVFVAVFFFWRYFGDLLITFFKSQLVIYAIIALFFIAVFLPASSIWRNASSLLRDLLKFFVKIYPSEIADERRIFRNLILISATFIVLIIFPSVFLFFKLHPLFNLFILVLAVLIIIFVSKSSSLIHILIRKHERRFNELNKKYEVFIKKRMKTKNLEKSAKAKQ